MPMIQSRLSYWLIAASFLYVTLADALPPVTDYASCNDRKGVPQFDEKGRYIGCHGMNPGGFLVEVPAAPALHAQGFASYSIERVGIATTVRINGSNGEALGTITGGEEYKGSTRIAFGTVQLPNRSPLQIRIEGTVMTLSVDEKLTARYRVEPKGVILEQGEYPRDKLPEINMLSAIQKDKSLSNALERVSYLRKPQKPSNCPWWVTLGACVSTPSNPASAVVCGACVGVLIIHQL